MADPVATGVGVCDRAQAVLHSALQAREQAIHALLARCESPIEEILLAALWDRWEAVPVPDLGCLEATRPLQGTLWRLVIEPQRDIYTQAARYRADFLISRMEALPGAQPVRWDAMVVEVDGHDFHDRTPAQALHDRRRDRALALEGFRVVRFTGREVYRAPVACVDELARLLGAWVWGENNARREAPWTNGSRL